MNLFAFLNGLSNKVGATLAAVYVVSQTSIALLLGSTVGGQLIAMQLSFTRPRFEAVVGGWSADDIERFQHHFYLDFVHPLWYAAALAWALAKTLPASRKTLVWLPVFAGLCDLGENTIHAVAVFNDAFRSLGQPAIAVSSTLAATKWLLALLSAGIIVYCFTTRRANPT